MPTRDYASASTGPIHVVHTEPPSVGRYRLESVLGRGGFGEVWKAFDPQLARFVAVKILRKDRARNPEVVSEFRREGQRLARIGPLPGIVTVFDVGETDGRVYLVSELIDGKNLAQRIRETTISHLESVRIVRDAARSLHQAHLKGIVHRDLKPQNLLLRPDGSIVIADFGLAITELEQLSEGERAVGTVAFMSPEQASGAAHLADPRSDVFSLGVILYQLLTRRLPFVAPDFETYRSLLLTKTPWPLRAIDDGVPNELELICLKCLEKLPGARFTTALDLSNALSGWIDASRAAERSGIARRRLWASAITLGVGLTVGSISAWSLFRSWGDPQEHPSRIEQLPSPSLANVQVVAWQPFDEKDHHGFDRDGRKYRFDAFGHALFKTGTGLSNKIRITMEYSTDHWDGMAGVFWDLRHGPDGNDSCCAVMVGRYPDQSIFQVQICRYSIALHAGARRIVKDASILKSIPVSIPNGSRASLTVDVDARQIVGIQLNGHSILDKAFRLPDRRTKSLESGFGFGGHMTRATVFDFRSNRSPDSVK